MASATDVFGMATLLCAGGGGGGGPPTFSSAIFGFSTVGGGGGHGGIGGRQLDLGRLFDGGLDLGRLGQGGGAGGLRRGGDSARARCAMGRVVEGAALGI